MRLIIDALGAKSGGSPVVLRELLRAAEELDRISGITLFASPARLRQFEIPSYKKLQVVDVPAAESPFGRFLWALRGLDRRLAGLPCNAFLGLNGMGSVRPDRRFVSLVFVQQPVPYSRETLRHCPVGMRLRMATIRWVTRRSVRAANHVLVQSEVMRDTISQAFDIPPARISAFMPGAPVLPPPATDSPKLQGLRPDAGDGVLLYVGSDSPHKNLSLVAEGLRRMSESERPRWYVTLSESSPVCRQGSAIGLGTLNRAELHEAYRRSSLLIMPSLTETVGLPMLEAMRAGTPVLAADRPYAHAMCEDAAAFFDPLSPDDLAERTTRLLSDAQWRADLVERGRALVKRRDSKDTYRAMLEKVVEVAEVKEQRSNGSAGRYGDPNSGLRRQRNA